MHRIMGINGWMDGWTNGHKIRTFGVCECVVEIIDSDHIDILKVEYGWKGCYPALTVFTKKKRYPRIHQYTYHTNHIARFHRCNLIRKSSAVSR